MKKEDVYIPDQSYSSNEIHHGGKWSEEAKQRYREARRAGRSVYDMFGNVYNKANKQVTSKANNIANRTIYKEPIARAKGDYKKAIKRRSAIKRNYDKINAVGPNFVNRGSSPQEKGRRADIVAKTKSDMRNDYVNSNKTVASKYNSIRKTSNHTLGEITKDATKAVGKEIGKSANKAKKGIKDGLRKADKVVTSAANKHVANKDRKHIDKEEKKYIDKRRKSALNVAAKTKKHINRKQEDAVNKANREANKESFKNAFNFKNRKEKEKEINEKRKKALKEAKSQAHSDWSEATKSARKRIKEAEERTVRKRTYSSVGDIVSKKTNKTASSLKKGLKSANKKLSKTIDDINTNKGKGYRLTGKTKVSAKGGYERYASDAERGDVYGKRKVSVIKEGKRANSITDALTGKTNSYKEYSTKTEYKMWKEPKKKSKSKSKSKHKKFNDPTIRQSGLDKVYIPGRTGVSETILHSDTFVK